MWRRIAEFILKYRIAVLVVLLALTGIMTWYAKQVKVSYEFTRAIPTDNPKYIDYQKFRNQFGEDGGIMVIAVQTSKFFDQSFFEAYAAFGDSLAAVKGVDNIVNVPRAVTLSQDSAGKMQVVKLWQRGQSTDSLRIALVSLPFYNGFLYNADSNSYLMAVGIKKDVLNSEDRLSVIAEINRISEQFSKDHQVELHYSGLPHIRTIMATKVQSEMKLFILLSFVLTAIILFIFFRSIGTVLLSMAVVAMGVIFALGTIQLFGFKITILTGLIPPLIVVIGIPNCVYFLNKYHSEYARLGDKRQAIINMVDRMGIVTLFTNLTAAIGFGVFYFTHSVLLKEFGLVAGINLMVVFLISLFFIPALLSLMPPPNLKHTSYLESGWMSRLLDTLSRWTFGHRKWIYAFTFIISLFGLLGVLRLRTETHIVDDLPKKNKVYQDLKFFERNFGGVMPLEIVVNTKKKFGATMPESLIKTDSLVQFLHGQKGIGHILAITEAIKFAAQAAAGGDSMAYALPDETGLRLAGPILRGKGDIAKSELFNKMVLSFMDSSRSLERISINMADVGSIRLPHILDSIRAQTDQLFPKDKYDVTYTGTSIVFLEGSRFIINSLRDSLILAFIMIFGCMIALFRSFRILIISIIVNIVPLIVTAGLMGWLGIVIKPSTVLVFSVALGITVDVTIRFLVSFKQDLQSGNLDMMETVRHTIHETGQSIIYTSLILMAGFAVFCLSEFDGTKSLGWLTSLTLFLAMITNLTLQPALLLWMGKAMMKRKEQKAAKDTMS